MNRLRNALLVLLSLGAPASGAAAAAAPRAPNLVFILADDLGYGDVGCYGQTRVRTPNIDRLAAEGTRFTHFYSGSPVCAPSRNVLMTGRHVGRVRIRGNAKLDLHPAPEDLTVAELLKGASYTTGLFGKWGLGKEGGAGAPTRKGFDRFFGYVDQTHAHNAYPSFLVRGEERVPLRNIVPNEGPYGQGVAAKRVDYAPDLFADEALAFVDKNRERPFFLYFATTLPHANNEAGDAGLEVPDLWPYENENWSASAKAYASMVTRLDRQVGQILELLDSLKLAGNTIVIFSSDNGPHREGGNDPDFFDSNGPLRGMKRDLYEGGIRVPFIVRWPGHTPAGAVSDHVGYFGDFMATAAELAGATPPPDLDSISLAPVLRGDVATQKKHDWLYWEFYEGGSSQAVWLAPHWKAVRKPMLNGPIELYDLSRDIGESHDVAAENPAIVERVRAIMESAHVPSPDWRVPAAAP
jgi:arylsulfatase A-like enzyme